MIERLMDSPQFSISQGEKESLLLSELRRLDEHHRRSCEPYARIASARGWSVEGVQRLQDLPYIPVGLFKTHRLVSVPEEQVTTQLVSSGTTGQAASRILLDKETATLQSKALTRIMAEILGEKRLPMVIVESEEILEKRTAFSARAAGVLGMMRLGYDHHFALDGDMALDEEGLRGFLERHHSETIFIFGFTFMTWKYLCERLRNAGVDLSNAVLVHSGGWKKLEREAVTNDEFKRRFREETGLERIYNFYGMVEQIGSIFVEGEDGFLYPPNFADVVVRNPETWHEAALGEEGVIQVISALPRSYPGHSLLTEDLGIVHGVDDSSCGRYGKRLTVLGRVPRAELRGCSDTHGFELGGGR